MSTTKVYFANCQTYTELLHRKGIKMYYVIQCDEDGDTFVEILSKEELTSRLEGNYWGSDVKFMTDQDVSGEFEIAHWGRAILIIEGKSIIPKPKNIIKSYEI